MFEITQKKKWNLMKSKTQQKRNLKKSKAQQKIDGIKVQQKIKKGD